MKYLSVLMLLLFIVFINGCKDDAVQPSVNPYAGTWYFTFWGDLQAEELITVDNRGKFDFNAVLSEGEINIKGSISENGSMSAEIYDNGNSRGNMQGNFSVDSGAGNWIIFNDLWGSWAAGKYIPVPVVPAIDSVSHLIARVGEKIIIYGKHFRLYNLSVKLNSVWVVSNKTSDSTLSVFIPYAAQSGSFEVSFYSPVFPDTVIMTPEISITDPCLADVCLDRNTAAAFEETDSYLDYNRSIGQWTSEERGDTVFISRTYLCGDECSVTNTLAFSITTGSTLPEFYFAEFKAIERMPYSEVKDTIRTGIIRIDQWNDDHYAGSFSFELYDLPTWVFWINRN